MYKKIRLLWPARKSKALEEEFDKLSARISELQKRVVTLENQKNP